MLSLFARYHTKMGITQIRVTKFPLFYNLVSLRPTKDLQGGRSLMTKGIQAAIF